MIEVTAAIIKNDDKILICQRPKGKKMADMWEFPGGKTEVGETTEQCIIRECNEELDITISIDNILSYIFNVFPQVILIALFMLALSSILINNYNCCTKCFFQFLSKKLMVVVVLSLVLVERHHIHQSVIYLQHIILIKNTRW